MTTDKNTHTYIHSKDGKNQHETMKTSCKSIVAERNGGTGETPSAL